MKKTISIMSVLLVVFLCSSFNAYANVVTYTKNASYTSNQVTVTTRATQCTTNWSSNSDIPTESRLTVTIQLANDSNNYAWASNNLIVLDINPNNGNYFNNSTLWYIGIEEEVGCTATYNSSNTKLVLNIVPNEWIVLCPQQGITLSFDVVFHFYETNSTTPPYNRWESILSYSTTTMTYTTKPSFSMYTISELINLGPILPANVIAYIHALYYQGEITNDLLQQILDAYNSNVPASNNVTNDAQSSSNTIDSQHQQETNIYNQTNQAIGSTGINNFQFDSQTIGGLGGVKNDFMAVWNALGTFNSIFITSLTIGLALSIVRHRRMFKQ